jgi:8-oxo-dGTP pyrophosphatase MutT (NUDIX family)
VVSRTEVPDHELPEGAGEGGADVEVIPAASVLLLRDRPFEVLMMQRHARSSFVPAVWVFPGGRLDDGDVHAAGRADTITAMKVCAIRELFEETGIWLGAPLADPEEMRASLLDGRVTIDSLLDGRRIDEGLLTLTARWIAPVGIPKRFDTWFFLAEAGRGIRSTPQPTEAMELLWIEPAEALDRHARGEFPLVFPTIRNLAAIAKCDDVHDLIASRRKATIPVTRPVLVVSEGKKSIVLPDGPEESC